MTRRRWIADEVEGDVAFLIGPNAAHLARVLRASVGQQFDVVTPAGVRSGTISGIEPQRVVFSLGEFVAEAEELPQVHLYLAVYKFDRLEWAIEKAVELGVAAIHPVISRRTEAHLAKSAEKRVERWRRIAQEAAQQSRRNQSIEVAGPQKLAEAMRGASGNKIVLAETERDAMLLNVLSPVARPVALAVGPEGGWTEDELAAFSQNGWRPASLGPTILRAETAAIAALAITLAVLTREGGENTSNR